MDKFDKLDNALIDYTDYSDFGDEDIPRLIVYILGFIKSGEKEVLATHAFAIIADMRTEKSGQALCSLLDEHGEHDWIKEEFPTRMILAGSAVIPALQEYLIDRSHEVASREIACDALTSIADIASGSYKDIVNFYIKYLKALYDDQSMNSKIVLALKDLDASGSIKEIEALYAKGLVNTDVCGSLESLKAFFDGDLTPEEIAILQHDNEARFEARKLKQSTADLRNSKATLDKIEWYLLEFGNPNSISDSVELHGFMTALVCSPNLVSTQDSVKEIFANEEPSWSLEEFERFFKLLSAIYEGIQRSLINYTYEARLGKKEMLGMESWREGFMNGMMFWDFREDDLEVMMDQTSELTFGIEGLNPDEQREAIDNSVLAIFDHFHEGEPTVFDHFDEREPTSISPYKKTAPRESERIAPTRVEPKVGRNEKCPCGSGKKYKKCCLRNS